MLRREFIAGTAVLPSLVWPSWVRAQQTTPRSILIGVLLYSTPDRDPNAQALLDSFRQLGWVNGQNARIEYRYAEGKPERIPQLAAELVDSKPDVIFALGGEVTLQVTKATRTIPIVYAMSADPVRLGIAASLAKPGGNASGVTFLSDQLAAKRLETFREAAPRISRVAILRDPNHADNELPVVERAAGDLKLAFVSVGITDPAELDRTLAKAKEEGADSLYVVSSRHTVANAPRIVEFANRQRLPLVGGWGAWVQAGGLISYGPNITDMVRQASAYLNPVLKGTSPGDLPVQQPTRFELHINLKTARNLGLDVPESFLLRADKVIE